MDQQYFKDIDAFLEECKARDSDFRLAGSGGHKYQTGTKMSAAEVLKFESDFSVELPADFRMFLMEYGVGAQPTRKSQETPESAGPRGGLYSILNTYTWNYTDLKKPFPLRNSDKLLIDEEDGYMEKFLGSPIPGAIYLGNGGCAADYFLIVRGDLYGEIWCVADYRYLSFHGSSFREWFDEWVNYTKTIGFKKLEVASKARLITEGTVKNRVIDTIGDGYSLSDHDDGTYIIRYFSLGLAFVINTSGEVVRVIENSIPEVMSLNLQSRKYMLSG